MNTKDTIVALATAQGSGAIAVIRLSGNEAIEIADRIFKPYHKGNLADAPTHSVHLGVLKDNDRIIDECLATLFKENKSYTGEPTVEFSCHGSSYIIQEVLKICISKGCRLAQAGEFTQRAFLNGKLALSQAEAVADLIASDNQATHQVAINQMRGGFTQLIQGLRQELLNFASLIELELDFAEEDVEFADRSQFKALLQKIDRTIEELVASFSVGNVIKNGIPVAIIGKPNAGKSTLLNALLNEERAIVSDIAGTTRDTIEEVLHINGTAFRLIDTAGIRETTDQIEEIGVQKAIEKIEKARILLYLYDENDSEVNEICEFIQKIHRSDLKIFLIKTKIALSSAEFSLFDEKLKQNLVPTYTDMILGISAKEGTNIPLLREELSTYAEQMTSSGGSTIITNVRHCEALRNAQNEIHKIQNGLSEGISGDLLAIDIRQALYHFGEITGEITNDEILGNIFSKFCIGK
ncbi:MAG: tRNA uridine-5-carboxymethylaminomethyl(34) synthesis GTPase MnmE [Capnocytophaga sp.]|nr:tRNA uridine-5-carboxymethylaminomethyl(34) synthesis GTPase MnmE [Capnocytophaga sp.]